MTIKDIVYNILGKDGTAQAWAQARATAGKGMAGINAQVSSMGSNIAASLAAALSVGAIASWVKEATEVAGTFKDLQDSFGATADGLSRIRAGAQLSGTQLADLEGPIGKLVKSLNDADTSGSDAGRALSELGLKASEVKAMAPDQAFIAIAEAMQEVEDGGGKAALATALFGKEGAKLIPVLNDVAEVGNRYTRITQTQIDAADEFDKSMKRLNGSFQDFKVAVGNSVIPAINRMIDEFNDARAAGLGFMATLGQMQGTWNRTETWDEKVSGAKKAIEGLNNELKDLSDWDKQAGVQNDIEAKLAKQQKLLAFYQSRAKAANDGLAAQLGVGDIASGKRDVSGFRLKDDSDKGKGKSSTAKDTFEDPRADSAKAWGDAMKALGDQMEAAQIKAMGLGEAQTTLYKLMTSPGWADMPETWRQTALAQFDAAQAAEMAAKADETLREAYDRTLSPLREKLADLEKETDFYGMTESQINTTVAARIEEAAAIARANGVSDDQVSLLEQEVKLRRQIAETSRRKEAKEAADAAARESAEAWKRAGDDIARSMTDSIYQGFQDGKPFAKVFADAIGSTIKTTLFRAVADGLMSPLKSVMAQLGKQAGAALGNLFVPSAHGNAFGSAGLMAFATGGVVSGATAFSFAGGTGVMGEAGPEAILPLRRTSSGDLGVIAQQGGTSAGLQAVRVELINQTSQASQAVSATPRFDAEGLVVQVVLRDLNNNGPIRQALGG
ncbi:hypothetical protein [uncultured Zoogloea sp.]|uniref:phage tail tape measure protein n=1 Tax=uncultured Zoogloea sp. TaxID=160237 RepID=UPI00262937DC|nr:hypothetical protein [uncultured Zoogloea sp.]